jgi:transposase
MTLEGAFDGEAFMAFTKKILIQVLHPDDHVIMDNLGIHKVPELVPAIEAVGAHVHFLPRYSPDLNPIESFWSTFKEKLRTAAARTKETLDEAIADGLKLVAPSQIIGWFKDCGYV